jgi:hypothetical protein
MSNEFAPTRTTLQLGEARICHCDPAFRGTGGLAMTFSSRLKPKSYPTCVPSGGRCVYLISEVGRNGSVEISRNKPVLTRVIHMA